MTHQTRSQPPCLECGKVIELSTRNYIPRKFCSQDCQYKKARSNIFTCSHCSKPFRRRRTELSKTGLYYCTRKCHGLAQRIGGLGAPKHYGTSPRSKSRNCSNCEQEITGKSRGLKYCTATCSQDFFYRMSVMAWKMGLESGTKGEGRGSRVTSPVRRYLWAKYDSKCGRCGWCKINPKLGRPPLVVDHITGNSQDSSEDNVILLCPNCHSLTETYCGLNKGNGREALYLKELGL